METGTIGRFMATNRRQNNIEANTCPLLHAIIIDAMMKDQYKLIFRSSNFKRKREHKRTLLFIT